MSRGLQHYKLYDDDDDDDNYDYDDINSNLRQV